MNNYDDYQLEEMENDAVNKSNNFKKAAVVGAAVLGVGGTAAFAASKLDGADDTLTEDDLMGMAEAGEVEDEVIETAEVKEEVHHHHHHHHAAAEPVDNTPEAEVHIDETGIIFDENGNYVGMVDQGTYDGKAVALYDLDGNGRADVIAYDANGNGVFENDEYTSMDNKSYIMGQGEHTTGYVQDQQGNLHAFNEPMAYDPSQQQPEPLQPIYDEKEEHHENGNESDEYTDQIHNDFKDDKQGEDFNDLAENNPDYNNNDESNSYTASMDDVAPSNETLSYDNSYVEESYEDNTYTDSYADNSMDMGGFDESADYTA